MSNFKIREKVVFKPIKDINHPWNCISIKEGDIVTIHSFCLIHIGSVNISECLEMSNGQPCSFDTRHFRKLDHQFAENVCAQLIADAKKETILN